MSWWRLLGQVLPPVQLPASSAEGRRKRLPHQSKFATIFLVAAGAAAAQSGFTVAGKVLSASDGTPVQSADVLLRAARESYLGRTDSAGRFTIRGVAPGSYECEASRAGFEARSPSRSAQPLLITVTDAPIEDMVLRLMPLGAISGRVVDPDGRPLPAAEILALQYQWSARGKNLELRGRAVSDDRGEFRIFGLYPGSYYLHADPNEGTILHYLSFGPAGVNRDWMPLPRNEVRGTAQVQLQSTFFPAALEPAQARAIVVTPGADAAPAEIRIQRRGVYSIRGKVVPADGDMVVMVEPRGRTERALAPRPVAKDGSFSLPPLPPGSYAVTAHTRGDPQSAIQMVEISDHDVEGVELHLGPVISISGAIKVAGSAPVQMASVVVLMERTGGGLMRLAAHARPDGRFMIPNVLPDIYRLTSGTAGVYITSIRQGDTELPDGALDVRRSGGTPLVVTVSAETGGVDGRVLAEGERPVPAYVTLIPDETNWDWASRYREIEADSEGRFSFAKLQPGRYTLFAWRDVERGAPLDPEFRKQFAGRGKAVTIEPQQQTAIELMLIP